MAWLARSGAGTGLSLRRATQTPARRILRESEFTSVTLTNVARGSQAGAAPYARTAPAGDPAGANVTLGQINLEEYFRDMTSSASTVAKRTETRDRLVESAAELFSRQGFGATGIKAVLSAARAPYGSLYHFFPGGKQELGAAALAYGGERYRELIEAVYPPDSDVVEATAASFAQAAEMLEAADYADACPIATIALEVANNDELMRTAAAAAFESWLSVLEQRFTAAGMTADRAREVAVEVFCLMEGSVLLARTTRSPAPLRTAGRAATNAVAAGLAAGRYDRAGRAD